MPLDLSKLNAEEMYYHQTKQRTPARIYTALLGTTAWGILETLLLRILGRLGSVLPTAHSWFMRFLHGHFGGVATPFEIALERDPKKRSWNTRQEWQRVNVHGLNDPLGKYLKKGEVTIIPNQEIMNLIFHLPLRPTVSYCFCRLYAQEKGHKCELNAPIRTCLTLSLPTPIDKNVVAEPREDLIKQKEAIFKLLKRADEIGLVHQAVFVPSPNYTYVICNCCPDCCEVLSAYRQSKHIHDEHLNRLIHYQMKKKEILQDSSSNLSLEQKKQLKAIEKKIKYHQKGANQPISPLEVRSIFISETIDPTNCINCGKCAERCYFDSRTMAHGKLHYNPELCYGCGLCVSTCPKNIIQLVKRKYSKLMAAPGKGIAHQHPHQNHHH